MWYNGSMKKVWFFIRKRWLSLLLGVIFSVIFISFVYSVWRDPDLSQALAALGTLILALVTSLAIINSNEREKRRRQEERRIREEEIERDFKRRCLNDIQDWADKGINVFASWLVPIDQIEMRRIRPHLKPLSALNKWVMDASRIFAGDDKKALLKKVDEAAENLKQYCEVLEGKFSSEGMAQRHDQCLKSFTEVLERIADLKVKLQL